MNSSEGKNHDLMTKSSNFAIVRGGIAKTFFEVPGLFPEKKRSKIVSQKRKKKCGLPCADKKS